MKCSTSQLDICREGRPGKGRDRRMPGGPEEERKGQHGWEGVSHEEKRSEVGWERSWKTLEARGRT